MLLKCKEDRCANRFPVDASIGFCVPKQCSKDDMSILLPYMMKFVNTFMPYQFDYMNLNDDK